MTTTVTLTGTGVPYPAPGRAGAGTLVRYGDVALQFDAGRSTTLRLAELGLQPTALTAVFLTHLHSDHVTDLPDLAMTRWIQHDIADTGPLPVVCTAGDAAEFVAGMLVPFVHDIDVRREHAGHPTRPTVALTTFTPAGDPTVVWTSPDGTVEVAAIAVHHEPVQGAVAYRVTTPDGTVVVSGDTVVCPEVELLSKGCDVLVHEVCRQTALGPYIAGTMLEKIFSYHADSVGLGAAAERAGVAHVVLTHLIPPPVTDADEALYVDDVRSGGYQGQVSVGRDLMTVTLG